MQRRRSRPSRAASARPRPPSPGRAAARRPAGRCRARPRSRRPCPARRSGPSRRAMIRASSTGRGGDQPDPLAGVEVHLGQRPGAGPDPVGHQLVVDLLAELDDVGDRAAGDERQRVLAAASRGRGPPCRRPGTSAAASRSRAGREVVKNLRAASPRAKWKIDAPQHHRVVDVEERGGGRDRSGAASAGPLLGGHGGRRSGLAGPDGRVEAGDRALELTRPPTRSPGAPGRPPST